MNIKQICLRFNLDKPLHKEAYDYLNGIDKTHFKSYTNAACIAITDFFKRYYRSQDDPYFETREREERFVDQILSELEKAVEKALPSFLTACLTGILSQYSVTPPAPADKPSEPSDEDVMENIDLDYIKSMGF